MRSCSLVMNLDRGCRRFSRNWSVKSLVKSVIEKVGKSVRIRCRGEKGGREEKF